MNRISRMLCTAWLASLPLIVSPATASDSTDAALTTPVHEMTSTGLITFSARDRAIRVVAVFAEQDAAVVETVVRFVDAKGNVLKVRRGELSDGNPIVAELTRRDVGDRPDLLVRAEVFHKLPGVRQTPYPILLTLQPISLDGAGRFVIDWNGGECGCPTCGPPVPPGQHANCDPPLPI